MIRITFVLAVLSVVAMFGFGVESALTYRYRPLGGELKFVRQPDKVAPPTYFILFGITSSD